MFEAPALLESFILPICSEVLGDSGVAGSSGLLVHSVVLAFLVLSVVLSVLPVSLIILFISLPQDYIPNYQQAHPKDG